MASLLYITLMRSPKIKIFKILSFTIITMLIAGQPVSSKSTSANQPDNRIEDNLKNRVKNIPAKEFAKRIKNSNGIILDVRTPQEVADGHIKGSSFINIYDSDFERKVLMMQKDKPVYVYCRSGGRSGKAAEFMIENGFTKVYNLTGGIGAWKEAKLPLVKSKTKVDKNIKQLSVGDFQAIIKKHDLVFVEFHTLWCSPCVKMAPIVDDLEKTYKGKVKIMRVDLDKSESVGKKYAISGVPTFVLFRNGTEEERKRGELKRSVLKKLLDDALR